MHPDSKKAQQYNKLLQDQKDMLHGINNARMYIEMQQEKLNKLDKQLFEIEMEEYLP